MDDRDRFDSLLAVLDELVEANESTPIVVEGKRDVAALRSLGCAGDIVTLHNGNQLFVVAEDLAGKARQVILLTDWDRKGTILLDHLQSSLAANGARGDVSFRERIRAWANAQVKDVESLLPYVRRGLLHFHKTSLEDHRAGERAVG